MRELKIVNPLANVILTVSPVPLMATYEEEHVLVATTYSKSVLRVAAEMISKTHENVVYFPSFEIITGAHTKASYYGPDCRDVTEAGVNHVMSLFLKHFTTYTSESKTVSCNDNCLSTQNVGYIEEMGAIMESVCDEEALDR